MKKLIFILLRFFVFIIVVIFGGLLIYDQIALDFGTELGIKGSGLLQGVCLARVVERFTTNYQYLGYYLVFYGTAGLFIFLSLALVLRLIPVLGKVIIFMIVIVPIISAILILFGSLIWTNVITIPADFHVPGFSRVAESLSIIFLDLNF